MIDIPFNRPWASGKEIEYIAESLESWHTSGNGPFTRRAEALIQEITQSQRALLTSSCTDALEMSAILAGLAPGDEVIVPSYTFVSSASAFALIGAKPVFADIRPDTLNIDESQIESLVTPRTRAIVVVHYGGVACEMDAICEVADRRGLIVIEDNAHGLFGAYRGRPLGSIGSLATQSFHETKNIGCGEGGALIVNDAALIQRAEIVREKGTDRSRFLRGEIDKYSWVDIGSSYLPSDVTAAYLLAQLDARHEIQSRRESIWDRYDSGLSSWAASVGARRPHVPKHCQHPSHLYYLILPSLAIRTRFIAHLRDHRIQAVFHYVPLHTSPMGTRYGGLPGACPVAEDLSDRLVRLPFHAGLRVDEQDRVVSAILSFAE